MSIWKKTILEDDFEDKGKSVLHKLLIVGGGIAFACIAMKAAGISVKSAIDDLSDEIFGEKGIDFGDMSKQTGKKKRHSKKNNMSEGIGTLRSGDFASYMVPPEWIVEELGSTNLKREGAHLILKDASIDKGYINIDFTAAYSSVPKENLLSFLTANSESKTEKTALGCTMVVREFEPESDVSSRKLYTVIGDELCFEIDCHDVSGTGSVYDAAESIIASFSWD